MTMYEVVHDLSCTECDEEAGTLVDDKGTLYLPEGWAWIKVSGTAGRTYVDPICPDCKLNQRKVQIIERKVAESNRTP